MTRTLLTLADYAATALFAGAVAWDALAGPAPAAGLLGLALGWHVLRMALARSPE